MDECAFCVSFLRGKCRDPFIQYLDRYLHLDSAGKAACPLCFFFFSEMRIPYVPSMTILNSSRVCIPRDIYLYPYKSFHILSLYYYSLTPSTTLSP